MRSHLASILAGFLLFAGCADIQALGTIGTAASGTVSQAAPNATLAVKNALIATHGLHEGVAKFMKVMFDSDICKGTCASQAKIYLDQSEALLNAADDLVKLGDTPGIQAKIAAATALISKTQALVGK